MGNDKFSKLKKETVQFAKNLPDGLVMQLIAYKPKNSEKTVAAILVGESENDTQAAADEILDPELRLAAEKAYVEAVQDSFLCKIKQNN